ncbi:hypothetical protein MRX96_018749 [Rhipicephalus microplus]
MGGGSRFDVCKKVCVFELRSLSRDECSLARLSRFLSRPHPSFLGCPPCFRGVRGEWRAPMRTRWLRRLRQATGVNGSYELVNSRRASKREQGVLRWNAAGDVGSRGPFGHGVSLRARVET